MAGGGVSAQQINPLTWQQAQPQIGQAYNFQTGQFGNYVQNQPLPNAAQSGALNFYNSGIANTATQGALANYGGLPGLIGNLTAPLNYYEGIAQSGGAAPAADVRDINQATLANANAAGSAFDPSTLGEL